MLAKGHLATNKALVEKAVIIIENLGATILNPSEVRSRLKLIKEVPK